MAEKIYKGTDVKLNIHIDPIAGQHMESYNFTLTFYTPDGKKKIFKKTKASLPAGLSKIGEDDYIVHLQTDELGEGSVKCNIEAEIYDVELGIHKTEIAIINCNIKIVEWDV